jgi:Rha family phage regulatory protein
MSGNPCLEVVETELTAAGVRYRVEHGGKHLHVMFGEGFEHLHVIAKTPSDWRAPKNERALIRRSLLQLGYVSAEDPVPTAALVTLTDGNTTCASYHVAEHFSKAHKDVLRAVDRVREECGAEFNRRNFTPIEYLDEKGRQYRAYRMTRDGFTLVAMGFTGRAAMEWKVKYIDAFNAMEGELRAFSSAADIKTLRGELDAVLELVAEVESRQQTIPQPEPCAGRSMPFIRASVLRKLRKAVR